MNQHIKIVDELVKAIPKTLLEEREKAVALLGTLEARKGGYEKLISENETKFQKAEGELTRTIASGQDAAGVMKKVQSIRQETDGLSSLITRTGDEIERVQAALDEIKLKVGQELARAVVSLRGEVEKRLEPRLAEIENEIEEWAAAIGKAAASLDCNPPSSGAEIVLKTRILREHVR